MALHVLKLYIRTRVLQLLVQTIPIRNNSNNNDNSINNNNGVIFHRIFVSSFTNTYKCSKYYLMFISTFYIKKLELRVFNDI